MLDKLKTVPIMIAIIRSRYSVGAFLIFPGIV